MSCALEIEDRELLGSAAMEQTCLLVAACNKQRHGHSSFICKTTHMRTRAYERHITSYKRSERSPPNRSSSLDHHVEGIPCRQIGTDGRSAWRFARQFDASEATSLVSIASCLCMAGLVRWYWRSPQLVHQHALHGFGTMSIAVTYSHPDGALRPVSNRQRSASNLTTSTRLLAI